MTSRLDNVGSEPVYLCIMGPVLQSTKSLVWLQEDQTYASRLEETEGITGGVSGHAAVGELCSQTIQGEPALIQLAKNTRLTDQRTRLLHRHALKVCACRVRRR